MNCLSISTETDKMVRCTGCNQASHFSCLRPGSRALLPHNLLNDINQVRIKIELAGDTTQVSVLGVGNYGGAASEDEE